MNIILSPNAEDAASIVSAHSSGHVGGAKRCIEMPDDFITAASRAI